MADSFNKKEREKKRRKRKQDKFEKRQKNKLDDSKPAEFMYLDENGNLSPTAPDPSKKRVVNVDDISISVPKKSELEPEEKIKKGIVKFFNPEKRFGFIREIITNQDYFVHADSIDGEIKENDKVDFEIGSGPKGLVAINVKHTPKVKEKVVEKERAEVKVEETADKKAEAHVEENVEDKSE
jgi:cold shock CspA family protein